MCPENHKGRLIFFVYAGNDFNIIDRCSNKNCYLKITQNMLIFALF